MDHVLVVNDAAGSTEEEAVDAAADVLRQVGEVQVVTTSDADDLDAVIERLEGRRLVVCGGDGSIHLAVTRLRELGRADEPVGLIPLGTGNDLARGVGLPFDDAVAAAERVRDGTPHPTDLLVDDTGRTCVNALHAGVGADASARAEALKERLAAVAYPIGAILAGVSAAGVDTEVSVDGEVLVDAPTLLVAVTNGSCFGGGASVCPDATTDDGALDVLVVTAVGPVARAAFALSLNAGEHLERDDVHLTTGREVRIRGEGLRYVVDGELHEEPEADRTWRVEHHAWSL
ncbi:MAG: diacylglycerol kinase family protein, partial [Nitriliruptor sp.]